MTLNQKQAVLTEINTALDSIQEPSDIAIIAGVEYGFSDIGKIAEMKDSYSVHIDYLLCVLNTTQAISNLVQGGQSYARTQSSGSTTVNRVTLKELNQRLAYCQKMAIITDPIKNPEGLPINKFSIAEIVI